MKVDWPTLWFGLAFVAVGAWGLVIVLRPKTTQQEVEWLAQQVFIVGVPALMLLFGCLGIWAAFSRRS